MNCHRDKTLDSYLGQMVRVKFKWDNNEAIGRLEWVEKITPQTPYKPQMYHCGNWSFYKSHIKSVVPLKGVKE